MSTYRIEQTATGTILWEGEAKDEHAAWDAHLIDAGYTPGEPSLDTDGKDLTAPDEGIVISEVMDAYSGSVDIIDRIEEIQAGDVGFFDSESMALAEILESRDTITARDGLAGVGWTS